jgi:hypothetical protein
MAWNISGDYYAPCSCKVSCPCALGELEADQGWCSGAVVVDVKSGKVDNTDISGITAVIIGDWPSGFLGGNGKGRLYLDTSVSQEQQAALESVLGGQRGGVFEVLASLVPDMLPTKKAPINLQAGDGEFRITVGDFGLLTGTALRGASGEFTRVLNGAAHFRDDTILAKGTGSYWRDPEMRQWESGGHAEFSPVDWSETHEH